MKKRGFTLVEALVAAALLVFLVSSVVLLFRMLSISMVKTKDRIQTQKLGEMGFSRLSRMPFWELVPLDSDDPRYGLQATDTFEMPDGTVSPAGEHPSKALLDNYLALIQEEGYDRFTVDVTYYRRDLTGVVNSSGTALMAFTPGGNPLIDQYDHDVRFQDKNGDGDYFDVFRSTRGFPYTEEWVSELPSTHMREVRLALWRDGVIVSSSAKMFNLGALSGERRTSSEALLRLIISTPTNNHVLYQATSSVQTTSLAVSISSAFPAYFDAIQVNTLPLLGWTTPQADIWIFDYQGNTLINTIDSDTSGNIIENSSTISPLINTFREGLNYYIIIAYKDTFQSPNNVRSVHLDVQPPIIDSKTPTGTVATRTPYVGARIIDYLSGGGTGSGDLKPSGILEETLLLEMNQDGSSLYTTVNHSYDSSTGKIYWIENSTSIVPPILSTETSSNHYYMRLSGSDKAGYKVSSTWDFEVAIATGDTSPPQIESSNCQAPNQGQIRVRITDPESGVMPHSIVMIVGGVTVLDSSNIGSAYNPETGWVTYTSNTPYTSGSSPSVVIQATHWGHDAVMANSTCNPAVTIP